MENEEHHEQVAVYKDDQDDPWSTPQDDEEEYYEDQEQEGDWENPTSARRMEDDDDYYDDEEYQQCMAGLPPTRELIALKVPYGAWEPDTLITDTYGNPMFSVLDVTHHAMGAYEAIFGDENGHKLCYVKRRLITKYWKDGWDFCTYKPNFPGQPKYKERDMYGKSVYPFSFLSVAPLKCRYAYHIHKEDMENMDVYLEAMHGWLGTMTVCCTPMVRLGKWQIDFHRPGEGDPEINIDQSKNLLEVERGNDLLAALCMAYAFDKALCQPLVTIVGYQEKEHPDDDDDSLDSFDPEQAPRQMAPPNHLMLENGQDYDDDNFQPSGYLGYEDDYEDDKVAGYLENDYDNDQPEISGYLADSAHNDDYDQPGYNEDKKPYKDDPNSGYIEDGPTDSTTYDAEDSYEDAQRDNSSRYIEDDQFEDEH